MYPKQGKERQIAPSKPLQIRLRLGCGWVPKNGFDISSIVGICSVKKVASADILIMFYIQPTIVRLHRWQQRARVLPENKKGSLVSSCIGEVLLQLRASLRGAAKISVPGKKDWRWCLLQLATTTTMPCVGYT